MLKPQHIIVKPHNKGTAPRNETTASRNDKTTAHNQVTSPHNDKTTPHHGRTTLHNDQTSSHNDQTSLHNDKTAPHNDKTAPHNNKTAPHLPGIHLNFQTSPGGNSRYIFTRKTPYLIYFTWCVLACCVVIFPIRCDFSDFFHFRPSIITKIASDNIKSNYHQHQITTQQARTCHVNKVRCFLLRISANTYLLKSITWIPIQILYVHCHFDIT